MEPTRESVVRPRARVWVWIICALLIVVGIGAAIAFMRARAHDTAEAAVAARQVENFESLARQLRTYADAHDGALPDSIDDPRLLVDVATNGNCTYRVIGPDGTRIARDPFGERVLVWTPRPSYRGRRAIVTNDLSVRLVSDAQLDLDAQRARLDEGLNRVRAIDSTSEPAMQQADRQPATEPVSPPR